MKFKKEEFNKVLQAFGIDKNNTESIYKYAPVFKCNQGEHTVILKKTKSDEGKAEKLFQWTEELRKGNIGVVTPVKSEGSNPIKIDDDLWVMYPFIEGRKYDGSLEDIKKAGQLLGKIHAAGVNKSILINGFSWDNYDDEFLEEVRGDISTIKEKYEGIIENDAFKRLETSIENILQEDFSALRKVNLPMVDGPWDYKASNLIYDKSDMPVLIDPDNSGHIPRIFDLALALILFHTEMDTAPGRVFTVVEWDAFKEGYFQYVKLSDIENQLWEDYLLFVFIDEAMWAIVDLEDDEPQRQNDFMKALLEFDPGQYKL